MKGAPRLLMLILAGYADDTGFCWPGQKLLADGAGMTTRGIRKITGALVAAGEIEIVEHGLGRGNSTRYLLRKYAAAKEERKCIKEEQPIPLLHKPQKRNRSAEKRNGETQKEERGDTKAEQACSAEPQNHNRTTEPQTAEDDFSRFWKAYPRKVGKGAAQKAWNKAKVTFADVEGAIEAQRKSEQWQKDGGQYIPHPATWLNQQRWEDELLPMREPEPERVEWNNLNPLAWLPPKVILAGQYLTLLREKIAEGDVSAKEEHDKLRSEHLEWVKSQKPSAAELARADAYYAAATTVEQAEYADFLKNYQP